MTWGEFKSECEKYGIKDDMNIIYIDIPVEISASRVVVDKEYSDDGVVITYDMMDVDIKQTSEFMKRADKLIDNINKLTAEINKF